MDVSGSTPERGTELGGYVNLIIFLLRKVQQAFFATFVILSQRGFKYMGSYTPDKNFTLQGE